jgi:peptide/nickel transport system permease protein
MTLVKQSLDAATRRIPPKQNQALRVLRQLLSKPMGLLGSTIVAVLVILAVFAPLFAPHDPIEQFWGDELLAPSQGYLLGTDEFGRDIFSRLIYGARTSLVVAAVSVGLGASVGIFFGVIAGHFGGWADTIIMRFTDVLLAFPAILVGIAIIVIIGTDAINVAYAIAILNIPRFARLVRGSVLVEREAPYVSNARCIGSSNWRIITRHILPNILGPILVEISLAMAFAVLVESALSFLGLGIQPPDPSWGRMLSEGRGFLRNAWWYSLFPGVALSLLLFGLNNITDTLRDILDPYKSAH